MFRSWAIFRGNETVIQILKLIDLDWPIPHICLAVETPILATVCDRLMLPFCWCDISPVVIGEGSTIIHIFQLSPACITFTPSQSSKWSCYSVCSMSYLSCGCIGHSSTHTSFDATRRKTQPLAKRGWQELGRKRMIVQAAHITIGEVPHKRERSISLLQALSGLVISTVWRLWGTDQSRCSFQDNLQGDHHLTGIYSLPVWLSYFLQRSSSAKTEHKSTPAKKNVDFLTAFSTQTKFV